MLTRNSQFADRFCIIGAGPVGLATAKTFKQRGIPFDCLERERDFGGLWNIDTPSGVVYETTHMVSSKEFTGFEDFPMPEDYPLYPSHRLALAYMRDYAEHFGIADEVQLGCRVERVAFQEGAWRVWIAGEPEPRSYLGVVIATGHHHKPRLPDHAGAFTGEILHTRDYRSQAQLTGKRILVVGAGNSGCDVVNDGVQHGEKVFHSMRRGYYFLRPFTFGYTTDDVADFIEKLRLPRWLRQFIYGLSYRVLVGPAARYGLPAPQHKILDQHPTINAELPSHVAHGRVTVKPDIDYLAGSRVVFKDGSHEEIDLIVYATGYEMSFPFLDEGLLFDGEGRPDLYLNVFHPQRDDLFLAGLVQANGSIWRLGDLQGQLIANFIVATSLGDRVAAWFRKLKAAGGKDRRGLPGGYVASPRHALEVDYFAYQRLLRKLNRKFGKLRLRGYPGGSRDLGEPGTVAGAESAEQKEAA